VAKLRALVVDFYGVLTDGLETAMSAWCAADGIDYELFRDVMGEWLGPEGYANARLNPVYALERGEMAVPDFEVRLAERLHQGGHGPVDPHGLVERMFQRFEHAPDMAGLVRRARRAGISTALLSNSWGDHYLRDGWDEMFDVVVISGEVGMRKPESRIFSFTAQQLGVAPDETVFVDDHVSNIAAGRAFGWVCIHHVEYQQTAVELEALFDVPLAG
jgi:putative hydrolase of the HAD superfamily